MMYTATGGEDDEDDVEQFITSCPIPTRCSISVKFLNCPAESVEIVLDELGETWQTR